MNEEKRSPIEYLAQRQREAMEALSEKISDFARYQGEFFLVWEESAADCGIIQGQPYMGESGYLRIPCKRYFNVYHARDANKEPLFVSGDFCLNARTEEVLHKLPWSPRIYIGDQAVLQWAKTSDRLKEFCEILERDPNTLKL